MPSFKWYDADGDIFDLTDTRFVLKSFDPGGITGVEQTIKGPYQQGETHICTLLDPAVVSLNFFVECTTLSEAVVLMQDIKRAFDPLKGIGYLYFTRDDGEEFRLNCIPNRGFPYFPPAYPQQFLKATNPWFTLNLQLVASDPFWYSGTSHQAAFFATIPAMFPFAFPWSLGASDYTRALDNAGTIDTPLIICLNNQMTNPVITNLTTGETLTLSIIMADGDKFEINTAYGAQTAVYTPTGGSAANGFPYITITSSFLKLVAGENVINAAFTSPSATAYATLTWSDKYIGVQ